jgi:hypothetical protein
MFTNNVRPVTPRPAVELIQGGYSIGIWSPASLEQRPIDSIAANDDVWIEALSKRLTG